MALLVFCAPPRLTVLLLENLGRVAHTDMGSVARVQSSGRVPVQTLVSTRPVAFHSQLTSGRSGTREQSWLPSASHPGCLGMPDRCVILSRRRRRVAGTSEQHTYSSKKGFRWGGGADGPAKTTSTNLRVCQGSVT